MLPIIGKEEKGRYINILANEDIREFKEWGIELQQKRKKKNRNYIFNNTEFNLKKYKEKGIERWFMDMLELVQSIKMKIDN